MNKKLTKLSTRGRADKSKKTSNNISTTSKFLNNLNSSDEDFKPVVDKPKRKDDTASTKNIRICMDSTKTAAQDDYRSASVPLSCPFCGKSFASGQTIARTSHMKACGNQLGVDAHQLLQIRKLEDKQAQEWKELNLPSVSNNTMTSSISNKSTVNKTKAKSERMAATSNDPQLEIALALSASLAPAPVEGTIAPEPPGSKCWLPQPPTGVKVKPFKSKAKTALQVRQEDQRKQQMLEIVSSILESNRCQSFESRYNFESVDTTTENLKRGLWWLAALDPILPSNQYYIDLFKQYITSTENPTKKERLDREIDDRGEKDEENGESDLTGLGNLSKAWNKLFNSGEKSDVIIYARDEEEIKAHTLVLHVGCPKLLRDSMLENDTQIITCPEASAYILKSFIRLLYTGRLYVTLRNEQDIQDAKYLAKRFPRVEQWRKFVENINNPLFAGFLEQEEAETEAEIASQNLSGLLEVLEEEMTVNESDEIDEEWSEMCDVLQSQKSVLTQSPQASVVSPDEPQSPDIFGSDDEDDDDDNVDFVDDAVGNENESLNEIRKRKSMSEELDQSDRKKSKLDLDSSLDEDEVAVDPNASQYSRRNVSTPSILKDLEEEEASTTKADLKTPSSATSLMPPDYASMLSPALQIELQRFGLKVIPRRKAVPLLNHIYQETHPEVSKPRRKVNFEPAPTTEEPVLDDDEVLTQNSSISEGQADEDLPEESINLDQIAVQPEDDLNIQLLDFIEKNAELHRQVLLFEPLWLEDLHQDFKAAVKGNVRLNHVQDILDSQCITFRTRARHEKNVKRNNKS